MALNILCRKIRTEIREGIGKTGMLLLPIFIYVIMSSCGLSENFKKIRTLNDALIHELGHKQITASMGWGSDSKDNYVKVLIYEFNVDSFTHSQLDSISSKARTIILENYPDHKVPITMEIRFTKDQDPDNVQKSCSFTYESDNK